MKFIHENRRESNVSNAYNDVYKRNFISMKE